MRNPKIPSLSTVRNKKIRQARKELKEERIKQAAQKEYESWRLDSDMEAFRKKHYPNGTKALKTAKEVQVVITSTSLDLSTEW